MPKRIGMIELLVVLTLLLLGAGLFVAIQQKQQALSDRIKCASNLKAIGQACLLYANENRNAWPMTKMSADEFPVVTWGTPYEADTTLGAVNGADPFADPTVVFGNVRRAIPADNDITAAMWLLMRTQDVVPEVFVCPASEQVKWDMGGPGNYANVWTNWKGRDGLRRHLSYSMWNVYRSRKMKQVDGSSYLSSLPAELPVIADMNPGTLELATVTLNSPSSIMQRSNSRNHAGVGQNVLYEDGHVEFMETPFCGIRRENLFRNDPQPTTRNWGSIDTMLLPTSADLEK